MDRALHETARRAFDALGLLPLARRCKAAVRAMLRPVNTWRQQRYYRLLIALYRSPFSRPAESYAAYEKREIERRSRVAADRYQSDCDGALGEALSQLAGGVCASEADLRSVLSERYAVAPDAAQRATAILAALQVLASAQEGGLNARLSALATGSGADAGARVPTDLDADRSRLVRAILDRVVDARLAPRFFDYDHVDDIVGIVGVRYCGDGGCDFAAARAVLGALCLLAGVPGGSEWNALPRALRRLLGETHGYRPARGDVTQYVWNVIPDLAGEFVALRAEDDIDRFLEINREYSRRQAVRQGLWDNRQLSLLRGYERDHHLLLRTLVRLREDGALGRNDEVLLVGPRHVDEVAFFRTHLGLPRTVGLDLFKFGRNEILAGDMHRMPFEDGRFKLVFCAGTLSYSFDVRRVVAEMARVTRRPGYVVLIDAAGRKAGPDALGRSDVVGIDTLVGLFHRHAYRVLARDPGRSLAPHLYENEPCLALLLPDEPTGWGERFIVPGITA